MHQGPRDREPDAVVAPEESGAAVAAREPDPVVAEFTWRLQRAYEIAGSPRPRRLLHISETLPGPVVIAKSTLHDNLSGTRLTLPTWDWVAVFIASLHQAAAETMLDPGLVGTIQDWDERHKIAKRTLSRSKKKPGSTAPPLVAPAALPLLKEAAAVQETMAVSGRAGFGLDGDRPKGAGQGDTVPLDMSAFFGPHDADDAGPPERSGIDSETATAWEFPPPWLPSADDAVDDAYRMLLGEHGVELLHAARRGDGEASCRLGILLVCWNIDVDQAMLWLGYAAKREDAMAMSLLSADPAMRRELAAAYALDLVLPTGTTAGDDLLTPEGMSTRSPAVYYGAAAEAGNATAAYRLGMLKEAKGDPEDALRWYEMADRAQFPGAAHRLHTLRATIRRPKGQH
jgi:hypothetical protein